MIYSKYYSIVFFSAFLMSCSGGTKTNTSTTTKSKSTTLSSRPVSDTSASQSSPGADPFYTQAWHLKNTGQNTYSNGHGISGFDINLESVYNSGGKGSGVTIMVADDGVESAHEDLHENILFGESRDYSLSSPNTTWAEPKTIDDNHGTSVAGIIAARSENSLGVRGIASEAKIINSNPLSDAFSNDPQTQADGLKDHLSADFDIANHSFGLSEDSMNIGDSVYKSLMMDAAVNGRAHKGKIIVKSGGNSYTNELGDTTHSIIRYGNTNFDGYNTTPYTINVGAMSSDGYPASYSTPGSGLWISAPGGEYGDDDPAILTTDSMGCNLGFSVLESLMKLVMNTFETGTGNPGCKYTSAFNGTSAAAPMISGVVALLLEANPNLTFRDIKYILAKTARKVKTNTQIAYYSNDWYSNYNRNTSTPGGLSDGMTGYSWDQTWITNAAGFNFQNFYGFGLVDTSAAVALAKTYVSTWGTFQETGFFSSASSLNLSIPDHSGTGVSSTINVSTNLKIEAIQIQPFVNHSRIGDVQLEITAPSGTKSVIVNANNALYTNTSYGNALFLTNAFYGENSSGNWTLKAIDGATGSTGNLQQWKIKVFGHSP